ncbi:MAG: phosphotransferase [Bacteroidales bacterium]|nr:phosphotransferase [Bacteroidales bacterium]
MKNRIPKRWEDVTPQWMTAALASCDPAPQVTDVELVTRDDGTNRRARFALAYSGNPGPARVFTKAHTPRHRFVHLRNGNLFNEARLFASGVPLPLDHPRVYLSVVDRLRLDFLLVMEDLTERGADPRDATRPMTAEQVADGLRGLARLHSQYWGLSARTHPALRWVKTWQPGRGWLVGLRKRIPAGLERAADSLPAKIMGYNTDAILDFWTRYVASLSRGPVTLLHGDAHIGNTYVLPDNSVGFLDWQVVRRGGWSQDVGYFLVGSLTEDDRRHHEADLLEVYRTALDVPAAQRPSRDEAWRHYSAAPAYGLAIWLSTLGSEGYQSREISLALAQRYATAFTELDTVAALAGIGA